MKDVSQSVFGILDGKTDDEYSFDPAQIQYNDYNGVDEDTQLEVRTQYHTTGYPQVIP